MKNIIFSIFALLIGVFANAQGQKYDWKNMTPEQRKTIINKMSPDERKAVHKYLRQQMVCENLQIDNKDKDEFNKIYDEYLDNQNRIKGQFNSNFNPDQLSEQEAKQKLQQSFDTGEQLLQNRKKYAEKMQQVVPPQKVLKLFQNEGMMRDKMNERKPQGRNSNNQSRSNQNQRR